MEREVIVGLDVGTTAVKAVAFEPGTSWRRSAARDLVTTSPETGHQVQDPDHLLTRTAEALVEVIADVVEQVGEACGPVEVVALSVSTAMHGLLALDGDLRPLTPVLTWADCRAADEALALHRSGQAAELHRVSGTPVHPMSPLAKLIWFYRHRPEVAEEARWWWGTKDLVLHWLTGEVVTELSSASGTGLLDRETGTWSPAALDLAGVDPAQLPDILPTTAVRPLAPAVAAAVGLPTGTPVVVGAADGPLGNVGTGSLAPGVAALSIGTSAAVRSVVELPRPDLADGTFCYAVTDDTWVLGGAISNGGSASRWAAGILLDGATTDGADEALLELAGQAPPGSDGLVVLPFLLPERAPLWDPQRTGVVSGLRTDHTRAHVARAVVGWGVPPGPGARGPARP